MITKLIFLTLMSLSNSVPMLSPMCNPNVGREVVDCVQRQQDGFWQVTSMFQRNLLREQASCELLKLLGDRCSDSWTECYSGRQVSQCTYPTENLV